MSRDSIPDWDFTWYRYDIENKQFNVVKTDSKTMKSFYTGFFNQDYYKVTCSTNRQKDNINTFFR
ncbi:MAG: hypothetical protein HC896_17475 [Bacteroidales bacterium]|nr:hypothetical protein [Bacteroidales bacterium]